MTVNIVGFEGQACSTFHVTWGAAAIRMGDRLVNAWSRRGVSIEELDRLESDGALTRFAEPLEVVASAGDPLIVFVVNTKSRYQKYFWVDADHKWLAPTTILHRAQQDHLVFTVFRNIAEFDHYRQVAIQQVVDKFLFATVIPADSLDLIRAVLELDPNSLWLNALRVYLSPPSEKTDRLARACLRGGDRDQFDRVLKVLKDRGAQ